MTEIINAIYENGVLNPLKAIHLKEHQKVRIIIQPEISWVREFKKLLSSVHQRTKDFSSKEIERNITLAYQDMRRTSAKN